VSYEPIHHKYRPQSFAQLVGQEAIATTLTNAILGGKIAHAYLFTGPRGTGKTSSARILAKSINCLQSDQPTPEPCGVCHSCLGITKGYTVDVIEIDAASNTGVDNIRELIEKAQFAPVQSRYKVYVIDECHMLSTAAFNALLKTLEEPPKHVVFILATTDPQRVLPTIISRCQRFDFRRIQLDAMVKHLKAIAQQEKIQITPEAIALVGQLAQGGLRDAESLLDQLALFPSLVTPEHVLDLVGSVSEQDLCGLLGAIAQDNAELVLDFTRKILDRGREPLTILQNLAAFYRDLLIAQTAPSRRDLVACTQSTWDILVNFAPRWDKSLILQGQKQLRTAEVQIKNTTQPRLWLEITLLGLLPSATLQTPTPTIGVSPISSPSKLAQNSPISSTSIVNDPFPPVIPLKQDTTNYEEPVSIPSPEVAASSQTETPPEVISSAEISPASVPEINLSQIWQEVIINLPSPGGQSLFKQHGRLISLDNGVAQVAMPIKLISYTKDKLTYVETAFEKVLRQRFQVVWIPTQSQTTGEKQNNKLVSASPHISQPSITSKRESPNPDTTSSQTPTAIPTPTNPPTQLPNPVKEEDQVINSSITQDSSATDVKTNPKISSFEHNEVNQAAKKLEDFFNGKIITLGDDTVDLSDLGNVPDLEIYEYGDD